MLARTIKICAIPNKSAVGEDPIKGGQAVENRSNPTEETGPKKIRENQIRLNLPLRSRYSPEGKEKMRAVEK